MLLQYHFILSSDGKKAIFLVNSMLNTLWILLQINNHIEKTYIIENKNIFVAKNKSNKHTKSLHVIGWKSFSQYSFSFKFHFAIFFRKNILSHGSEGDTPHETQVSWLSTLNIKG